MLWPKLFLHLTCTIFSASWLFFPNHPTWGEMLSQFNKLISFGYFVRIIFIRGLFVQLHPFIRRVHVYNSSFNLTIVYIWYTTLLRIASEPFQHFLCSFLFFFEFSLTSLILIYTWCLHLWPLAFLASFLINPYMVYLSTNEEKDKRGLLFHQLHTIINYNFFIIMVMDPEIHPFVDFVRKYCCRYVCGLT